MKPPRRPAFGQLRLRPALRCALAFACCASAHHPLDPPIAWQDFASIRWQWTVYDRRAPDRPPGRYAGRGGPRLLRSEAAWRVVGVDAWIT